MRSPITISVEDDPTPIAMAIAADLAALLADPSFVQQTEGLEGMVSLRATASAETLTLRLGAGRIALQHGFDEGAELKATVDGSGRDICELEGEDDQPELVRWLRRALDPPVSDWRDAGQRFWSVLEAMPGAPSALLVVDLDRREEQRYGSTDGRAYEIHGSEDGLIAVLTGRTPLLDAAFEGRVYLRGSFREISVLSGAGHAVRLGLVRA